MPDGENTASQLSDAIGAFRMQLDARPNIPAKKIVQPSRVERVSGFGSQLRKPEIPKDLPIPLLPPLCGLCGPVQPAGRFLPIPIYVTFNGVRGFPDNTIKLFNVTPLSTSACSWEDEDLTVVVEWNPLSGIGAGENFNLILAGNFTFTATTTSGTQGYGLGQNIPNQEHDEFNAPYGGSAVITYSPP